MATKTIDKELIEREKAFWDTMISMDGEGAAGMTDKTCIVAGAQGVASIDPMIMGELMKSATWKLHSYSMDEKDMHVRMAGDNVAILAYKVDEDLTVDNQKLHLTAYDTSVWVRQGKDWLCAMHTESVAGDPFGRDKKK